MTECDKLLGRFTPPSFPALSILSKADEESPTRIASTIRRLWDLNAPLIHKNLHSRQRDGILWSQFVKAVTPVPRQSHTRGVLRPRARVPPSQPYHRDDTTTVTALIFRADSFALSHNYTVFDKLYYQYLID